MYYLTTENALDLIELDIIEEKADSGSNLATHMKKYYKYYLILAGLVTAITAAIIIAKKNGDKEGAEQLEDTLKEAKKAKEEAEKVVNENKKTLAKITNKTVNIHPIRKEDEIERTKEKVRKNTEEIRGEINRIKNRVPGNYIDKSKFTYDDIYYIGGGKHTDEVEDFLQSKKDLSYNEIYNVYHSQTKFSNSDKRRKKRLKKGVKAIDEIEKGEPRQFSKGRYDRRLEYRNVIPKKHNNDEYNKYDYKKK